MALNHYTTNQKNKYKLSNSLEICIEQDLSPKQQLYMQHALDLITDAYSFKGKGAYQASLTQKTGVINLLPQRLTRLDDLSLKEESNHWQTIENSRQLIILHENASKDQAHTFLLFKDFI
ncbi:MAG: hypothetical protein ACOCQQ_03095 [Candidatus Nanoarchaeia archaeon]